MKGKRAFLGYTAITMLFAWIGHVERQKEKAQTPSAFRIVFSGFLLGAFLAMTSEINVDVANTLGMIVAGTSVVLNGKEVFDVVTRIVGNPGATPHLVGVKNAPLPGGAATATATSATSQALQPGQVVIQSGPFAGMIGQSV